MNIQTIKKDGKPIFAIIPYEEYSALVEAAEDTYDLREYHQAKADLAAGEEIFPAEFVEKLLDTDLLLKAWREYRGMTQGALAEAAGLTQAAIAQIESGSREPKVSTAAKIAAALGCDIDDIVNIET